VIFEAPWPAQQWCWGKVGPESKALCVNNLMCPLSGAASSRLKAMTPAQWTTGVAIPAQHAFSQFATARCRCWCRSSLDCCHAACA
jgi:hypothetical protein